MVFYAKANCNANSEACESQFARYRMKKRYWIITVAFLFARGLPASDQDNMTNSRAWSGVIIKSGCSADEAYAEAPKCTESLSGGRLTLYDDTTRQVFELEPQTQAVGHLADAVTVHGGLEGNTIHVSSVELLNSIGIPVGRKAPPFSARDQFGREQTLDSLKGPHGTVLLFFRSADW